MKSVLLLVILVSTAAAIGQEDEWEDDWEDDAWSDAGDGARWSGFVEGAGGSRWNEDPAVGRKQTLGEIRTRLENEWDGETLSVALKGDVWYDGYLEDLDGDLRTLALSFSAKSLDFKLGRQVLTWGTGDLVFLNDLFAKDWVSFFAGRDDEYLKAPSNAVRATWYTDAVNVDMAWMPKFEPDNYLTGERFSFFAPLAGQRVAPMPPLRGLEPGTQIENGEFALRLFRTVGASEQALYVYRGFYHQPTALTVDFEPTFAPLTAFGASLRRSIGAGVFNIEGSYYASRDDGSGTDPLIPNDEVRLLLGYEWEAMTNVQLALQYYLEWTQEYDELITQSLAAEFEREEFRHVVTARLTYRLQRDKLVVSFFGFYSPSDRDYYLRPVVTYRHSDRWTLTAGANLFGGDDVHTFFDQFADNGNLYARIRFNY